LAQNQKDINNKVYISIRITTNKEKEVVMQENLYKGKDKTCQNFVVTKENVMGTTRYS